MKNLAGLLALAMVLSFASVTYTMAEEPAPAPTEEKDKKPSGPHASDDKEDKKDDKGGK